MDVQAAKELLVRANGSGDPVLLSPDVLPKLALVDLPAQAVIEVGHMNKGVIQLSWNGRLTRDAHQIVAHAEYCWSRKHWNEALGLAQYLDLVRRAVAQRRKQRGDVALISFHDDGVYVELNYYIKTGLTNLGAAFRLALEVSREVEAPAVLVTEEVAKHVAAAAELLARGAETQH